MIRAILFIGIIFSLVSCGGPDRSPSIVFMPDMYYSVPYEPYQKATFGYPDYSEDSSVPLFDGNYDMSALTPVEGSVPHTKSGLLPYTLPNTNEGYEASKANPNQLYVAMAMDSTNTTATAELTEKNIARGEKLYNQTCIACHGPKGDGQGSIVVSGAYSGVPNYKDREITVGSVYHVIMHGRNAMGSYASQLNDEDRWRVAEYVMQLRNQQ